MIVGHRGAHNRLGLALQLTTVRSLGLFLADPLEVPGVVLDYLAGQLEIADASCVARYMERRTTRFEHAEEIKRARGLRVGGAIRRRPVHRLPSDRPRGRSHDRLTPLRATCRLVPRSLSAPQEGGDNLVDGAR